MARSKQIDGLRGMAALSIVFFHLYYRYQCLFSSEPKDILFVSYWGEIWVGVFFVISGYFMFTSEEISPVRYLIKRFYRLYPMYFISVVLIFICVSAFGLPGRETNALDLLLNLLFVNGYVGSPYIDSAHWYMTYTVSFCLFAALCILIKLHKDNKVLLVLMIYNIFMRVLSKMFPLPIIARTLQVLSGGGIYTIC